VYDVFIKVCSLKDVFQKNKKFFFFQKKTAISLKKIIALACCRILVAVVFTLYKQMGLQNIQYQWKI
jgi:hypothetical protein